MKRFSPHLTARSALLLLRDAPEHARILRAMLSVSLFVAITKLIGAAREVVIAATYGTSLIIDAYAFLMNLLSWPGAISSSVLMTVLVPHLVRQKLETPSEATLLQREILGTMIVVAGLVALVGGCSIYFFLSQGLTGLPRQTASLAVAMFLPMVLTMPIAIVAGFLAANVMAEHRQTNTLLEGVPAICILVLLLALPSRSPLQLAWATLTGFVVQLLLLMLAQPVGERLPRPLLSWRSPAWRGIIDGLGAVLLGQIVSSGASVVDQIMVAPLGFGANAKLGYANRIISLLCGLGATAIGRALLPVLSELNTSGPIPPRRVASRWMGAMFLAGVVMSIIVWGMAPWGIRFLFQRGAFTAADADGVAEAFRWGVPQLPFYFAGIVVVQVIASANDYRKFLYIGVINFIVKTTANFLLIPVLGIGGALLATSVMYAVACPALWLFSRK
jgi:peptidoglycan biosynthesis protein MviN/MurJ (putative lipid II flippase)